jgi:hypothetical protein
VNNRLFSSVLTWKDPRSPGIRPQHGAGGNGKHFASRRQQRWRTPVTHAVPPAGYNNDAKLSMTQVTVQKRRETERIKPARPVPSWFIELTPRDPSMISGPGSSFQRRSQSSRWGDRTRISSPGSPIRRRGYLLAAPPRSPPPPLPALPPVGAEAPCHPGRLPLQLQETKNSIETSNTASKKPRCSFLPSPGGSRVREVSTEVLSRPRPRPRSPLAFSREHPSSNTGVALAFGHLASTAERGGTTGRTPCTPLKSRHQQRPGEGVRGCGGEVGERDGMGGEGLRMVGEEAI